MSALILLEILLFNLSEKEVIIILLQIMILTADIIYGVTLNYHFYISRTDPIAHVWLIQNLIDNGHVTNIFDIYKPFPLWHILCTFMYKILGTPLSIQKTMFFTNGIIYLFIPIITYLISIRIFKEKKIALLSALFISLYPDIIFYGMSSISRSVVSFLEVVFVLLILYSNNQMKRFIAIILLFSLIIYHTASPPFILFILLSIYILERVYTQGKEKPFSSLSLILLFISMTLFYWMYHAQILFETIISNILTPAPTGIATKSIIYTPLNELFNYLQYSPLLFFIIIGFFGTLQSKKISDLGKIFCMFGLFSVLVSFPGPSLLINKLASNLNIVRFGEYTFLFIGLTGAIGFYELYKKSRKYEKIILILLFTIMIFLSVSNDFNASDNPLVKRPFYTFYLTDDETIAFRHIASSTQGYIMTDYITTRYLYESQYKNRTHIIEVDEKNMKFLRNETDDVFLIRKFELTKRPLKFYSATSNDFIFEPSWENNLDYYYQDLILWDNLISYNKIYDSKSVSGFN